MRAYGLKSFAILMIWGCLATAQAQSSFSYETNVSSPAFLQTLHKVDQALPAKMRQAFADFGAVQVNVQSLNKETLNLDQICGSSQIETGSILGMHQRQSGKTQIYVDPAVVSAAEAGKVCANTGRSAQSLLEEVLFHETAHAYDFLDFPSKQEAQYHQYCQNLWNYYLQGERRGQNELASTFAQLPAQCQTSLREKKSTLISSSDLYQQIILFKGDARSGSFKNKKPERSVDNYEYTNAAEFLAVNFSYYMQDPEYACRRPRQASFFKEYFGMDPFPNRTCSTNYQLMMAAASGTNAIRDLDPSRVYRIDFLTVSPGKGIASRFGHSMFRVVVCAPEHKSLVTGQMIPATPYGPDCVKDEDYHVMLTFYGGVNDVKISLYKGIMGGYPSLLMAYNFAQKVEDYTRYDMRSLTTYPLKFSEEQKKNFLDTVLELTWEYSGDYKFASNNCATESYSLIKSSVTNSMGDYINYQFASPVTPNGALESLEKEALLDTVQTKVYNSKQTLYAKALEITAPIFPEGPSLGLGFFQTTTAAQRADKYAHLQNATTLQLDALLVIEEYFSGLLALDLQRNVANYYFVNQYNNPGYKAQIQNLMNFSFQQDYAKRGYGVPLKDELDANLRMQQSAEQAQQGQQQGEDKNLQAQFGGQFAELNLIQKNIETIRSLLNSTKGTL